MIFKVKRDQNENSLYLATQKLTKTVYQAPKEKLA